MSPSGVLIIGDIQSKQPVDVVDSASRNFMPLATTYSVPVDESITLVLTLLSVRLVSLVLTPARLASHRCVSTDTLAAAQMGDP